MLPGQLLASSQPSTLQNWSVVVSSTYWTNGFGLLLVVRLESPQLIAEREASGFRAKPRTLRAGVGQTSQVEHITSGIQLYQIITNRSPWHTHRPLDLAERICREVGIASVRPYIYGLGHELRIIYDGRDSAARGGVVGLAKTVTNVLVNGPN